MSGADVQLEVIGPPRPKRRWWRHLVVHLALAPVIILIAALVYSWNEGRHVARQLDEIRVRGEPATAADLAAFHRQPPPERDATQLWIDAGNQLAAAFKALPETERGAFEHSADIPPPGRDWEELPTAEKLLADNAAAMTSLHRAADLGGAARFPIDFSLGIAALLPDTQNTRDSRRALALEAFVRARHGNAKGAADSLHAALLLGRALEYEPFLISQSIRARSHLETIDDLRKLFAVVPFEDANLAELQQDVLAVDFHEGYKRALLGDRVVLLIMFDHADMQTLHYQYLLRNGDERCMLDLWHDAIEIPSLPWHEQQAALDEFTDGFAKRVGKYHIMSGLMFPAINQPRETLARATAASRVVGLGIAAERYRKKHGRPPARLADLVPEFVERIPDDPFTGRALHYKADDAGYTVYSLGGVPAEQRADLPIDAETGGLAELVFRYPPKPWEPPKLDPQFDNPFDVELEPSVETEVDPEETSQPSAPGSTDQEVESNLPREDGGTPDPETSP